MYLYLEKLILDMGRLTLCSEHIEETLSWQMFYEKRGQEIQKCVPYLVILPVKNVTLLQQQYNFRL